MTQMPPKVDVPRAAPVPPVPVTLADTGLTADKVEALIVKTLYSGEMSGLQLSESLRLPYPILEPIIEITDELPKAKIRIAEIEALLALEQASGQDADPGRPIPRSEEDCQELACRERRGSDRPETFPRPFRQCRAGHALH